MYRVQRTVSFETSPRGVLGLLLSTQLRAFAALEEADQRRVTERLYVEVFLEDERDIFRDLSQFIRRVGSRQDRGPLHLVRTAAVACYRVGPLMAREVPRIIEGERCPIPLSYVHQFRRAPFCPVVPDLYLIEICFDLS